MGVEQSTRISFGGIRVVAVHILLAAATVDGYHYVHISLLAKLKTMSENNEYCHTIR